MSVTPPLPDRVERRLADLSRFGAEAAFIVGYGFEAYSAGSMEGALLRNAGERVLIKVATVVEKPPQSYKEQFSDVDWVGIMRMRNLNAHHYDKVNDDLMFRALAVRIPGLITALGL
ncbi:HepT-like ribonuclease domain-containing protein [Actinomyces procaprae]|uniref:HepT-like ribonuclease domain-containing protein n=1 Tax=Actinomyces procaprae TaxID=2560010 RepID=UPI00109E02FE|nr:HepT-like ribonuclease domain-containing protein [Actinomyces procaprae]